MGMDQTKEEEEETDAEVVGHCMAAKVAEMLHPLHAFNNAQFMTRNAASKFTFHTHDG